MVSLKHIPVDELSNMIKDPEKLKNFSNEEVRQLMGSYMSDVSGIFHEDLPYEEIRDYVEERHKEIFSKLDENERKTLRWEHIGSTSIPCMPGINAPDACIIYEQFPPSVEIIKALQDSSFYFLGNARHMGDSNDLWFLRFIMEEGFLKGSVMAIHLVDQNSTSHRIWVDVRDTCKNEQWAFDEYKENKLKAVESSDGLLEYKHKNASSSFINKIRHKSGLEDYNKSE